MGELKNGSKKPPQASSMLESNSVSTPSFTDQRPEAQQHQARQAAANRSSQVQEVAQLQAAANTFVGQSPLQRTQDGTENDSASLEAPSGVSVGDSTQESGGGMFSPELGADTASATWFRDTYLHAIGSYQAAQSDMAQLDLVLKAIHRNYGSWFAQSNQGNPEEIAAKTQEFKYFESQLIGAEEDAPGRYWCLTNGLEMSRAIVNAKLDFLKSNTTLVEGLFKDALSRMRSHPGTGSMDYASNLWEQAKILDDQIFETKGEIMMERAIASDLLESGNTKFSGGTAKKGIAIDAEALAEDRAGLGLESAGPTSLHQDDGPTMALQGLKKAMVEYVLATRAKEALRDRLGVSKLKNVKKKTLKEDPALAAEITQVRKRKDDAEVRFKASRSIVKEYLKGGLSPEIKAEVMDIDQTYLGMSQEDAAAHVESADADRAEKGTKAEAIGAIGQQMALSEAKYAQLKRSFAPIAKAGVGAKDFSLNFGVDFSLGLGKSSGITISGGLKYSGKTDLQDDRKLRVTHSFGVSGSGSAELAGVLSASAGAELVKGKTEVFMDVDHWASVMAYRFSSLTKEIHNLDDTQNVLESELSPEEAAEVLSTSRLAEDKVTKVDATAKSGSLEAGVLGIGASGSYESKKMTFSKEGEDKTKKASQTTKSVSISPSSDISISLTRTIIDGHANPDNDGKYWNVKMELSKSAAAKFSAYTEEAGESSYSDWEQGLRRALGSDPAPSGGGGDGGFSFAEKDLVDSASAAESEGHFGDIVSSVSSYLGAQVAGIDAKLKAPIDLSLELGGSASFGVEWNFVNSGGKNRLQYYRTSGGRSMSLSGGAPVGSIGVASVSVSAGAGKGQSMMLSERLGGETLTYLQTVFNGLHVRDQRNARLGRGLASEWEKYIQGHDQEVWVALCKIASGEGGAYAELTSAIASGSDSETAPAGMDAGDWAGVQAMHREACAAGQQLLETATAHLSGEDLKTFNAGKFALVKAVLTNYLMKQGALDKKNRDLEWA